MLTSWGSELALYWFHLQHEDKSHSMVHHKIPLKGTRKDHGNGKGSDELELHGWEEIDRVLYLFQSLSSRR